MSVSDKQQKLENKIKDLEKKNHHLKEQLFSIRSIIQVKENDFTALCNLLLDQIQIVTQSKFAIYGFINPEQTEMTVFAMSDDALKECKTIKKPFIFPLSTAGIWADSVRKRKTIIINDYSQDIEGKKGIPEGHVPITRFLSIPIFSGEKISAIAVAANKESDYTDDDATQLKTITNAIHIHMQLSKAENEAAKEILLNKNLLKCARLILEEDEFIDAARNVFNSCKELIGGTSGYIALLSDAGTKNEVLFLEAGGLECTVDPNLPMPVRGLRAEAYKLKKAVYSNDFMNCQWVDYMPEGHVILKNVLFAPLILDNKAVGVMGIANKDSDFTEEDAAIAQSFAELAAILLRSNRIKNALIESEKELLQTRKMEAIGTLAGGIAHDFNNILGIILGNTEVAIENTRPDNMSTECLEDARTACLRAKDLIKQILNFTRKTTPNLEPLNIYDTIYDSLKLIRSSFPSSIDIETNIPSESSGYIMADKIQINQIFLNLCTNALQAMKNEGTLLISLKEINIDKESHFELLRTLQSGRYFKISVSDTGAGKEKVLFIDDELMLCKVTSQILGDFGYQITCCNNSEDALKLFKSKNNYFDIVVTDMTLPNMTGNKLAAEMLKIRPDIPIILCTGYSDEIDEKKAKEIGIREFLIKPIKSTDLAATIREVIDNK